MNKNLSIKVGDLENNGYKMKKLISILILILMYNCGKAQK
jgi:hypothetical protein